MLRFSYQRVKTICHGTYGLAAVVRKGIKIRITAPLLLCTETNLKAKKQLCRKRKNDDLHGTPFTAAYSTIHSTKVSPNFQNLFWQLPTERRRQEHKYILLSGARSVTPQRYEKEIEKENIFSKFIQS